MTSIKDTIGKLARPLLVKYATRGVLWALTTWLGMAAAEAQTTAGEIGNAAGAIGCAALAIVIDYFHHRADKAEKP